MIRTKIVAVPKGSATSGLNPYKSNNGSSSISPSTGSGSSSSGGDSTKDCLWQTGDCLYAFREAPVRFHFQ